ncbi:hypothetical protein SETIT_1G074700v2 [Setaria italica]|uniref:Protein JASON n=1 Tax=Setaria italica TaxID=4555 RepID=K3YSL2_SETIT|nr:protein JASON [Setaria italica]RCV05325.1 hypothetical protein SETIT_1G074700v2 [Setaria italica]
MGCFLSCFRGGSEPSGDLRDPLVRESRIGDAFLNDDKRIEAGGRLDVEAANGGGVDEELRREANYLKSCGTISQTPPEILEFSSPATSEDTNERNDTSSNVQVMEETKLLEGNLSEVSKSDEPDSLIQQQNIDEGIVRVESESGSSSQDNPSFQTIRDQKTDSSDSPYPTPLVLRGDIQTPGTVYTACMGTSKHGKRARASRQFIYPVLRPIENKLQWMELKAAESPVLASNPPKRRNMSSDFSEKPQQTFASSMAAQTGSPNSEPFPFHDYCAEQDEVISPDELKAQNVKQQLFEGGEELPEQGSEDGKHGVSSLAYWLKPSSADDESHGDTNTEDNVEKEPCYEKSVFDVPIFPASAFNWDIDNPTPVLPKAWDGNGIPNTTTKYKEDQKVSWHATPFEERLMKVLSDEKPLHERKISGKLIHLEENAE